MRILLVAVAILAAKGGLEASSCASAPLVPGRAWVEELDRDGHSPDSWATAQHTRYVLRDEVLSTTNGEIGSVQVRLLAVDGSSAAQTFVVSRDVGAIDPTRMGLTWRGASSVDERGVAARALRLAPCPPASDYVAGEYGEPSVRILGRHRRRHALGWAQVFDVRIRCGQGENDLGGQTDGWDEDEAGEVTVLDRSGLLVEAHLRGALRVWHTGPSDRENPPGTPAPKYATHVDLTVRCDETPRMNVP